MIGVMGSVTGAVGAGIAFFRVWPTDALQTKQAELLTVAATWAEAGWHGRALHLRTLALAAQKVLESRGHSILR
jgi:hypothetical protein